jgi:hypothetical protein
MEHSRKSYVCIEVFKNEKPVLLVSREHGDWCFLCGGDHPEDPSFFRVVGIGHVLQRHPELNALLDLKPNEEAEREAPGKPWIRTTIGGTIH